MRVLVTGGAGFIGSRLAQRLLERGTLMGRPIDELVLADQAQAPAALLADARVRGQVGPLGAMCEDWRQAWAAGAAPRPDAVFHLASAVSGECELDLELGLRSNLDATRALLDALRGAAGAATGATPPRLVFASSIAVFGPDPVAPFPELVGDDTLATPQTSYGTQKLMCEQLIADYARRGLIDGRSARLVTVTVRPGRPNGAASSFFSGIVREPLAGQTAELPVDPDVRHPVASPGRTVDGLLAVAEADAAALRGRRAVQLPGLNVSVREMLEALARVAGPAVRARVVPVADARIAGIVAQWPRGVRADRAAALGLQPEGSFDEIIRAYIDDRARHDPAALKGMEP